MIEIAKHGYSTKSVIIDLSSNYDIENIINVGLVSMEVKLHSSNGNDSTIQNITNGAVGKYFIDPSTHKLKVDKIYLEEKKKILHDYYELNNLLDENEVAKKQFEELIQKIKDSEAEIQEILRQNYKKTEEIFAKKNEIQNMKILSLEQKKELDLINKEKELQNALLLVNKNKIIRQKIENLQKSQLIEGLKNEKDLQDIRLLNSQLELKQKNLESINNQNEIEKLKNEKILKDENINKQKFIQKLIIILLVILSLFLLFVFYFLKKSKKINKLIALQKIELEESHLELHQKHKEITDSINYAERIQRSFLTTNRFLNKYLNDYFIFFQPKEVVSGDFYWAGNLANGNFAVSCADSTGHGVPGAIMSILNISSIEKAVENNISKPQEIFNHARQLIIERLKKDGSAEGGKDGMDASLISFNPEKTKMEYVAAHNPIWIIRDKELIDIKGEKMPVGKYDLDHIPFKGGEFNLQKGDIIYSLTDGFQDQFGGDKGKKFKVKPFKRLLIEIADFPMKEQHLKISETFKNWKGDIEQVDDVCVIGIKI